MSAPALRVGLTGGLASGKSTVSQWLRDAGFEVIDADRLVAELYQPGGEGAAAVRALFGPDMLDERGAVDHAKVAARVFSDPAARASLEAAIHPLVRKRFEEIDRRRPGGGRARGDAAGRGRLRPGIRPDRHRRGALRAAPRAGPGERHEPRVPPAPASSPRGTASSAAKRPTG